MPRLLARGDAQGRLVVRLPTDIRSSARQSHAAAANARDQAPFRGMVQNDIRTAAEVLYINVIGVTEK
jgi:hypothetical protein